MNVRSCEQEIGKFKVESWTCSFTGDFCCYFVGYRGGAMGILLCIVFVIFRVEPGLYRREYQH